jgi:galactoside O-acetyltransferase
MTNPTVPEQYTGVIHADVVIGAHVIIGSGSVILPGVVLGKGCAIGALSLVRHDCDEFEIYVGVPAVRKSPRKRALLDRAREFLANKKS